MLKFPSSVAAKLGYYVYIYSDPRVDSVFYVGKGNGNRVFDHLSESGDKAKHQRIQEIREAGFEPYLEILVHGLKEHSARVVEASIIDLLGRDSLTNEVGGWGSREYGRFSVEEIAALYCETPANIRADDAVILIRINQLFYSGMPPRELYEVTRGVWVLSRERAQNARYVFAVFDGVVREVYEVAAWFPGGTTAYFDRASVEVDAPERSEFVGRVAEEDVRRRYVLKSVAGYFPVGAANPIRYVNC